MQRVQKLLEQQDYRLALVRLWVLGLKAGVLNSWELKRKDRVSFLAAQAAFSAHLSNHHLPGLTAKKIAEDTLALIRALDDFVAKHRALTAPAMRASNQVLPIREDGKDYWLQPVTLSARRQAAQARQTGNLSLWFHHHAVIPATTAGGLRVQVTHTRSHVDDRLQQINAQPAAALKVWVGHFDDGADVTWIKSPIGNWRTSRVLDGPTRSAAVLKALRQADSAGAHVVVFPEFTIDLAHRKALVDELRRSAWQSLAFVVAGSFHEPVGDAVFNTAPVYGLKGIELFSHRKIRLFGGPATGAEDVSVGDSVNVLASPVGWFTVLICKDFMDSHLQVESLLSEVPVDWVLVPSFGDDSTIRAHRDRAKKLACVTVGTSTVVAQTRNTAVPPKPTQSGHAECVRGFAHLAGQKAPEPPVGEGGGLVSFPVEINKFID